MVNANAKLMNAPHILTEFRQLNPRSRLDFSVAVAETELEDASATKSLSRSKSLLWSDIGLTIKCRLSSFVAQDVK